MNTRQTFLLGILAILFISCEQSIDNGFLINGKIEGYKNPYLYLKYGDRIDSSLVQNDAFTFMGKTRNPIKGVLSPASPNSDEKMTVGIFMLENSKINIFAKYTDGNSNIGAVKFLDIDSIHGSKSQELRKRFDVKMNNTVYNQENDSLKRIFLYDILHEFISDNPTSEMSGEYLADLSRSDNYLSIDQIESLFKLIDTSYQEKSAIESILKSIGKRQMFLIGNAPPEIILPDLEGNLINRQTLNGKVVLLEFWASWCVPCRQTNPELLNIYSTSKDSGFEILGISVDKDINKWKDAIKKDKINWLHVIDSIGISKSTFNLNSIPFNLLLNREGKIIAQNIKPMELIEILSKEL